MSKKKVLKKQLRAALFAVDLAIESIEIIKMITVLNHKEVITNEAEKHLSNNIEEIYETLSRIENPELLKR
tara:strand:+ start:250 stop:462 length:213 start_codon:yes stop_codon:yes gene_type:complete